MWIFILCIIYNVDIAFLRKRSLFCKNIATDGKISERASAFWWGGNFFIGLGNNKDWCTARKNDAGFPEKLIPFFKWPKYNSQLNSPQIGPMKVPVSLCHQSERTAQNLALSSVKESFHCPNLQVKKPQTS